MNVQSTSFDPVIEPPVVMASIYGPKGPPTQRAKDIAGLVSLKVRELFPDIPEAIYHGGEDVSAIRAATEAVLADIDMSMIQPKDSVNILCSEHGFGILGGFAYAEMIKTVRDVVEQRTGCESLRLVVIAWLGFKEAEEIIEFYGFREAFKGNNMVRGATPFDRGIAIETEVGTLYGLAKVYNAKWIIHTHYDDPREIYAHRVIDRVSKPFGMSYARFETRSIFHMNFGARSGNFISRAIADSAFVKEKLAFSVDMCSSPDGITGFDADNDLRKLGDRVSCNILSSYGKMLELLKRIDECIVVLDGGKWPYYVHAGGMIFGQLFYANKDWYDLENDVSPTIRTLMRSALNRNIKAVVLNQSLIGLSIATLPMVYPTIVASEDMAETMRRDMANPTFMDNAATASNLTEAIEWAKQKGGTDKIIFFDGTYGSINLSPSMAQMLMEKAREVDPVVAVRLPRWLKQRGIDPELLGAGGHA
ncbi:hypothetical protein [Pseudomonas sp. PDM31]|uniref:hypothetical protein n=1 Tax=Pseudomonas sp. PDM31 TaxID=2854778 RepID=UPI001C491566|nr:hypothetical protein [Pseudomonas sp. PDM31]MBV7477609.1 hypothetical protein [Pseudomonas sp. PDM31]